MATDLHTRPETRGRTLRQGLAWLLAAAAVVHPLAGALARLDWRADLLSHFREPALIVSLLAAAMTMPKRRKLAAALGMLAAWQAWGLADCSWPNPVTPDPRTLARLRVVSANVLVRNEDRSGLIELVRLEQPDILGLIEVSHAWLEDLGPIKAAYPYRYERPADDDGTGLALWLKARPISVETISALAPGGLPAIHAVVDFAGRDRHLWLVHFVSPLERPPQLLLGGEFQALAGRSAATAARPWSSAT